MKTLISVIIPSFNREAFIAETLDSVLAQSDPLWECIVVDDGSTDETIKVIQKYVDKDDRFRLIERQRSPKGANTCRNIGSEVAKGDYLIFLDSDDILHKDLVKTALESFSESGLEALAFYCAIYESENWDNPQIHNYLENENKDLLSRFLTLDLPWITSSVVWEKAAFLKKGKWNEELQSWQDWDLFCRALSNDLKVRSVKKISYFWRIGVTHDRISNANSNTESIKKRFLSLLSVTRALVKNNKHLKYESHVGALAFFWCSDLLRSGLKADAFDMWKDIGKVKALKRYSYFKGLTGLYFILIINKIRNFLGFFIGEGLNNKMWRIKPQYLKVKIQYDELS